MVLPSRLQMALTGGLPIQSGSCMMSSRLSPSSVAELSASAWTGSKAHDARPSTRPRRTRCLIMKAPSVDIAHALERLRQITQQVVGMFQPHRQPQEVARRTPVIAFHGSAMLDQALHAAQAGGLGEKRRRGREGARLALAAINAHRQHAAEGAHLLARDGMSGVRGKARV